VEHHPQFQSKLEGILDHVFNTLEPEVSAAIRKEKNEDSCLIFKLLNDTLGHILGYAGEKQYDYFACVSERFHETYHETSGGETLTSKSPSRAQLFIGTEHPDHYSYHSLDVPKATSKVQCVEVVEAWIGSMQLF